jgi:hypothetical protein
MCLNTCKCIIEYKDRGINLQTLTILAKFAKFFIQPFGRKTRRKKEKINVKYPILNVKCKTTYAKHIAIIYYNGYSIYYILDGIFGINYLLQYLFNDRLNHLNRILFP